MGKSWITFIVLTNSSLGFFSSQNLIFTPFLNILKFFSHHLVFLFYWLTLHIFSKFSILFTFPKAPLPPFRITSYSYFTYWNSNFFYKSLSNHKHPRNWHQHCSVENRPHTISSPHSNNTNALFNISARSSTFSRHEDNLTSG